MFSFAPAAQLVRVSVAALLLVILATRIAAAQMVDHSEEIRALKKSGLAKYERRDYVGAVADYDRLVDIDPSSALAYYLRGTAKEQARDPAGAEVDFQRSVELNPEFLLAHLALGRLERRKNNLDGAAAEYARVLQINPKYDPAYVEIGALRQMQKDYAGAESEYTTALKLAPRNYAATHNRALVRAELGRYPDALTDVNQAIALKPDDADNYGIRGSIELRQEERSTALKDFRRAVQLDPERKNTFHNIANIEAEEGHYAEALTDLQHALPAPTPYDEDYAQLLAWGLRKHLGHGTEADQELSAYFTGRPPTTTEEWTGHVGAFLLGRESEETLSTHAADNDAKKAAGQRCEACCYSGLKKLFSGDKAGAAECFRRCLATEQTNFFEYRLAQAELRSL